jgi:hypothetical protein
MEYEELAVERKSALDKGAFTSVCFVLGFTTPIV